MTDIRCKMCGGDLKVQEGSSIAVCEYCGSKQSIPKTRSEIRINLFNRANHLRRNSEYDKAMDLYEKVLNEDDSDAEAYWSVVLCRYGIEYVEEPRTHKRIPTMNRTQYASIYADEDYRAAILHADDEQKAYYEDEAKAISRIQKGILEISEKEEPYDVFICYKEADENGNRTMDSVMANELYDQLDRCNIKTFFARITLEDKLGTSYEPHIFSALHSAKVMVVFGTMPEYFTSVWVKNEWSRFLSSIRQGQNKYLIPAYRDMDPYDMPEEFSNLQAQDMSKLGAMQDLVHGIKKFLPPKKTAKHNLKEDMPEDYKYILLLVEHEEWQKAVEENNKYIEKHPLEPYGYLVKLMISYGCHTIEELEFCTETFDQDDNYKMFLKYSSADLKRKVMHYNALINERKNSVDREASRNSQYEKAKELIASGTPSDKQEAIRILDELSGWKDSNVLRDRLLAEETIGEKYYDYVAAYPILQEKEQTEALQENLINMLRGEKPWIPRFTSVSVGTLIMTLGFAGTNQKGWAVFFGLLTLALLIRRYWYRRFGIAGAIKECRDKLNQIECLPNFYDFAPELVAYKDVADAYIQNKNTLSMSQSFEEWSQRKEEVMQRREQEKDFTLKRLTSSFRSLTADLRELKNNTQRDYAYKRQKLIEQQTEINAKIQSLYFFQFSQKNELQEKLVAVEGELDKLGPEMDSAILKINSKYEKAKRDYESKVDNIDEEIAKRLPLPRNPEEIAAEGIHQMAVQSVKKHRKYQMRQLRKNRKEHLKVLQEVLKLYS